VSVYVVVCVLFYSLADSLALLLETRLVEKSEHILLVSLDARLVKRIDTESVCAHAACELKEIEQTAEVVLIDLLDADFELRNSAVDMGESCSELGHCAAVLYMLAGEIVELVEILAVRLDDYAAVGILNVDDSLEHYAVAFLDELAHGVEVGGVVD
jgi:hypothetical protein